HALHQASAAQQPHQLVDMGRAQALPLGELGSGQRPLGFSSDLEQAAEPVFLLRTQPHGALIRKTYQTVKLIGRGWTRCVLDGMLRSRGPGRRAAVRVTLIGHATLYVEAGDASFLVDPVLRDPF